MQPLTIDSPLNRQVEAVEESGVIGEMGPPRERARIHTELAAAYFERGNLGVALEELRISIGADGTYAPAYNVLGLVHMELRENPQAQQSFERALRLNPTDPDSNHNYGWFLCQTDREDQSVQYFLTAIKNPLYATPFKSYTVAATCLLRKNREKEALEYLDRALRLDSGYVPALINAAQIRYRRGELAEARDAIGRYNKIVEPTPESLWLALRIERRLGDKNAEINLAGQLRRRFPGTREYQDLQRGQFE
ncbi:MAG: type IV pilus biogenesis/stability protein PilW [Betaproteobacteria bacterium]|nr:type IV pilus biogenesis/stability protein PilW [Betaproteobacteria bacterium]